MEHKLVIVRLLDSDDPGRDSRELLDALGRVAGTQYTFVLVNQRLDFQTLDKDQARMIRDQMNKVLGGDS